MNLTLILGLVVAGAVAEERLDQLADHPALCVTFKTGGRGALLRRLGELGVAKLGEPVKLARSLQAACADNATAPAPDSATSPPSSPPKPLDGYCGTHQKDGTDVPATSFAAQCDRPRGPAVRAVQSIGPHARGVRKQVPRVRAVPLRELFEEGARLQHVYAMRPGPARPEARLPLDRRASHTQ